MNKSAALMIAGLGLLLLLAIGLFLWILNDGEETEEFATRSQSEDLSEQDPTEVSRRRKFRNDETPQATTSDESNLADSDSWQPVFGAGIERGRARAIFKIQDAKGAELDPNLTRGANVELWARHGEYWIARPVAFDLETNQVLCPPRAYSGLDAGSYRMKVSVGSYGVLSWDFELGADEVKRTKLQTTGFRRNAKLRFVDDIHRSIGYLSLLPQFIGAEISKTTSLADRPNSVFADISPRISTDYQTPDLPDPQGSTPPAEPKADGPVYGAPGGYFMVAVVAGLEGSLVVPLDRDPLFESEEFLHRGRFLDSETLSFVVEVQPREDYHRAIQGRALVLINPNHPEPPAFLGMPTAGISAGKIHEVPAVLPPNSTLLRIGALAGKKVRPWARAQQAQPPRDLRFYASDQNPWCLLEDPGLYALGASDGMGFFARPTFFSRDSEAAEIGSEISIEKKDFSISLSIPTTLAAWTRHAALIWQFTNGAFADNLRDRSAWRSALRTGSGYSFESAVDAVWPDAWPKRSAIEFRLSSKLGAWPSYNSRGRPQPLESAQISYLHRLPSKEPTSFLTTSLKLAFDPSPADTDRLGEAKSGGLLLRCLGNRKEGLPWVNVTITRQGEELESRQRFEADEDGYLVLHAGGRGVERIELKQGQKYKISLWSKSRDPNRPDREFFFEAQDGWTDLGLITLPSY